MPACRFDKAKLDEAFHLSGGGGLSYPTGGCPANFLQSATLDKNILQQKSSTCYDGRNTRAVAINKSFAVHRGRASCNGNGIRCAKLCPCSFIHHQRWSKATLCEL